MRHVWTLKGRAILSASHFNDSPSNLPYQIVDGKPSIPKDVETSATSGERDKETALHIDAAVIPIKSTDNYCEGMLKGRIH